MAAAMKKCTAGTRHKWEWKMGATLRSGLYGMGDGQIRIARKGVYQCACGAKRYGDPRSGL